MNVIRKIFNKLDNKCILLINSSRHPALMAYLGDNINYYNLNTERYERYITWNKKGGRTVEVVEIEKKIKNFKKKYKNIYLVRSIPWDFYQYNIESGDIAFTILQDKEKIEHVYTSYYKNGIELFYIYKVKN